MLPNMAEVLLEWEQEITLRTVETTTVDFEPVEVVTDTPLLAVVQPTDAETITTEQVDWSKRHYTIHSRSPLDIGYRVVYQGVEYEAIQLLAWGDYGYWEAVFEEWK